MAKVKKMWMIIIACIVIILVLTKGNPINYLGRTEDKGITEEPNRNEHYNEKLEQELQEIEEEIRQINYIKNAYQQKWLFSHNEKDAYYKITQIATKNELKVFAKVRLLDLVTPIKNHSKYKTNLWKVQAKHVDFVLTTENLIAKYIIELDDNSHETQERKERDKFVDTVLTTCGYKVLHIRGVKEEEIQAFINKAKSQ